MKERNSIVVATILGLSMVVGAQTGVRYPLDSADGLRLHNVTAEPATLNGKKGLRVTASEAVRRRLQAMTPEERQRPGSGSVDEQLAVVDGVQFGNGDHRGRDRRAPSPPGFEGARGFVGIAFRVQQDLRTYDAFYLRPTNGRADDQVRRNHSVQYISHPEWTWFRLRTETTGEVRVLRRPRAGEWTKVRIEVRGAKARLYVHDQAQPTLIVNDVKTGPKRARGDRAVARRQHGGPLPQPDRDSRDSRDTAAVSAPVGLRRRGLLPEHLLDLPDLLLHRAGDGFRLPLARQVRIVGGSPGGASSRPRGRDQRHPSPSVLMRLLPRSESTPALRGRDAAAGAGPPAATSRRAALRADATWPPIR